MSQDLTVRPLQSSDLIFVRSLASQIPEFTVPSKYEFWMLRRFDAKTCAVVKKNNELLGYILARSFLLTHELFIWQLASTNDGERLSAPYMLVRFIYEFCKTEQIERVIFTTSPGSSRERAIRSLSIEIFGVIPLKSLVQPASDEIDGEEEYTLSVKLNRDQNKCTGQIG